MMRTDSEHPSPTLPTRLLLLLLLTIILARLITVEAVRCGQRPIAAPGTITSGEPSWPGQFPWHAAVWHRTQQLMLATAYACGGFIVGPRAIITAAHCVTAPSGYQMAANELTVRVGLYELLAMARHSQEHPVQVVHRHARFSSGSPHHDLALLTLRTLIEFDAFVQPICLPRPADDALSGHLNNGVVVYGIVSGWGLTEGDGLARTLRMSTMPTVSHLQCLASDPILFAPVLYEGMFCAGWKNGTNVCNGDSGGAFAIHENGHWTALGIVSFTGLQEDILGQPARCSNESLAGFISIPSYLSWIESIAHSEAIELASVAIESRQEADRISEQMCQRYRRGCEEEDEDFSYLASVVSPAPHDSRHLVIDCFAVLISDRFLLAPASCRRVNESPPTPDNSAAPTMAKQFIILESAGQAVDAPIKIFHQHPNFVTEEDDDKDDDTDGIPEGQSNLALIELERKVSLVSTCQFACLWTPSPTSADSRSVPDQIFLYSAVNVSSDKSMAAFKRTANRRRAGPSKAAGPPGTGSVCYDELLAPTLMTQVEERQRGEIGRHYRLVGIVLYRTCTKIRFIKVALFLDWIEWIVWQPPDVA
ncbi:polyserase-2-like [Anopheles darlingi]|uniref:polyserase-2-like n=1 Tax=Anopheles darlingi TaxID=43151 RepID=UPI0020FFF6D1|nr:polyserase-2-like [Anopheles darlingi]